MSDLTKIYISEPFQQKRETNKKDQYSDLYMRWRNDFKYIKTYKPSKYVQEIVDDMHQKYKEKKYIGIHKQFPLKHDEIRFLSLVGFDTSTQYVREEKSIFIQFRRGESEKFHSFELLNKMKNNDCVKLSYKISNIVAEFLTYMGFFVTIKYKKENNETLIQKVKEAQQYEKGS